MSIKRSVLHDNTFWNPNTERRKVPYRFDASRHHFIGYFLSNGDRYSQYPNIYPVCLHTGFELIGMINRNAIDVSSDQLRLNIKSPYNLQSKMCQTRIAQQGTSQTSYAEQVSTMQVGKTQKIFEHLHQTLYFIPYTGASGNIHIRQILRYL